MEQHYDLVIIGSGSGNTLLDERFASQRVAIVDHGRFGGTCLNVGCIPTKMLVYPADLSLAARTLPSLGVSATVAEADWRAIRDRVFGRLDPISDGGLAYRQESENVDVYEDTAVFTGERTLRVGHDTITADQVVVANGSRPVWPDLPGIEEAMSRIHTSDSIMRIEKLPKRLVVLGGGYIAAELAHVFATFGVKVTVVARSDRLLRREDGAVSRAFTSQLSERVDVQLRQTPAAFETRPSGVTVVCADEDGAEYEYDADLVLLALGRVPNSDTLGCEAGGIKVDEDGFVVVDEHQRTTAPGVWALGDVCSPSQLKHVANHEARVVQHNLLHPDDLRSSHHDAIPHAVFSSPQVASVGLTEEQAREQGLDVSVGVQDYADVAFGWAMEIERGKAFCKVLVTGGDIIGAHVVGPEASLLVQPLVQALTFGTPARDVARGQYWIHPALSEVVENAILKALGEG